MAGAHRWRPKQGRLRRDVGKGKASTTPPAPLDACSPEEDVEVVSEGAAEVDVEVVGPGDAPDPIKHVSVPFVSYGSLKAAQKAQLDALRAWFLASDIDRALLLGDGTRAPPEPVDLCLLRFLRVSEWNVAAARDMLCANAQWRHENDVKGLLLQHPKDILGQSEEAVHRLFTLHYPHWHLGYCRRGRPVLLQCYSGFDTARLKRITPLEGLVRYHVWEQEMNAEQLLRARYGRHGGGGGGANAGEGGGGGSGGGSGSGGNSRNGGGGSGDGDVIVETYCIILDFKGMSLGQFNGDFLWLLRTLSDVDRQYYPGRGGDTYLVNTPPVFNIVWRSIRGFMERTQARIHIFGRGEDWRPALQEAIAPEELPPEYGGCGRPLVEVPFLSAVHAAAITRSNAVEAAAAEVEAGVTAAAAAGSSVNSGRVPASDAVAAKVTTGLTVETAARMPASVQGRMAPAKSSKAAAAADGPATVAVAIGGHEATARGGTAHSSKLQGLAEGAATAAAAAQAAAAAGWAPLAVSEKAVGAEGSRLSAVGPSGPAAVRSRRPGGAAAAATGRARVILGPPSPAAVAGCGDGGPWPTETLGAVVQVAAITLGNVGGSNLGLEIEAAVEAGLSAAAAMANGVAASLAWLVGRPMLGPSTPSVPPGVSGRALRRLPAHLPPPPPLRATPLWASGHREQREQGEWERQQRQQCQQREQREEQESPSLASPSSCATPGNRAELGWSHTLRYMTE
ncbi:unnamed protein product [Phaeothamnion confervicola]